MTTIFSLIFWVILLIEFNFKLIQLQYIPYFKPNRMGIVELFEWRFLDIAQECEYILGPSGYGGVQVSPVQENVILLNRPWYERYQPISYIIKTRSGTEMEFLNMTKRCNQSGVRIYVDIVINNMASIPPNSEKNNSKKTVKDKTFLNVLVKKGTAGSVAMYRNYPGVPYKLDDFNRPPCEIENLLDAHEIRNCDIPPSLPDLNHTRINVQNSIVGFMNRLIELGAAGFRVSGVKYMWPNDLKKIYGKLNYLNRKFDFPEKAFPFIFQEVFDMGYEPVSKTEYTHLGVVTEFLYPLLVGKIFTGILDLNIIEDWGPQLGLISKNDAIVFIDNHDNQRRDINNTYGFRKLNYMHTKQYRMASAFMLSYPFGMKRIMSSYNISDHDYEKGPPMDENENILSPISIGQNSTINDTCINNWICEHRWSTIVNMIKFGIVVSSGNLKNVQIHDANQVSYDRGNFGFIIFNNDNAKDLNVIVLTSLLPGIYCDVISGQLINNTGNGNADYCTGLKITVDSKNMININLKSNDEYGVIAIHIQSRLQDI